MAEKYLPTTPGYFTGNYTGKVNNYLPSIRKNQLEALTKPSFIEELKAVTKEEDLSKQKFSTTQQIQNIPNSLPFTALVSGEIGPYGLIFASSVMRLCQYYKKSSPPPRYF